MKRVSQFILLCLVLVNQHSATNCEAQKTGRREKIVGTVVAQNSLPLCVGHPCAVWLIVRLDDHEIGKAGYAQLAVEYFPDVRLPDNGFPTELVTRAREWQFQAVRNPEFDEKLEQFLKVTDLDTKEDVTQKTAAAAWRLLVGAENEQLPFEQVLPYFEVTCHQYKPKRQSN